MITDVICFALQAYVILLFGYVVLSWVPNPPEPFVPLVKVINAAVDPVVRPIRAMLPPLQLGGVGLDLSILVLFFAVYILQTLLCR